MKKDPKFFLEHILESIKFIQKYLQDLDFEDFLNNQEVQDAVLRRFEIIGEAVKNLPEKFKLQYRDIPWKKIAGMRDVLIHEYFGVDLLQIWNTVQKDLDDLEKRLKKMI